MPQLRQILYPSVLLVLGCSSPTETDSLNLAGRWVKAPEDLSPSGWYQTHLHLGRGGLMVSCGGIASTDRTRPSM